MHARTRLNTQTLRRTTSRVLLTFSHVPLLVRVPAYGSYERPRGKTDQKKPAQENVILAAWIAHRHTHTHTHIHIHTKRNWVYKYSGKAGSGRVEKAQWKTVQSLA